MNTFRSMLEAKKPKLGAIISDGRRTKRVVGTVEDLTDYFSYTLETGNSYKNEKGNKKINMKPKTVKSLAKELEKSLNNSGNSGSYYFDDKPISDEDYAKYEKEGQFSE